MTGKRMIRMSNKIYVLTNTKTQTSGHGESAGVVALGGKNVYVPSANLFPAFKTREAAEEYLSNLDYTSYRDIMELTVYE